MGKTRVVILGGGYVAMTAASRLGQCEDLDVTVVNRHNFHAFHGFVSEMLTGKLQPGQIASPARRMFKGARIDIGDIERIDLERREVVVARELDGRQHTLSYDHLVISLGTLDKLDAFPGQAEYAFPLRKYDDCFVLRDHIIHMLDLAEMEEDPDERRRLLTFVLAGAGYAGTEVAACLRDHLNGLLKKEYRRLRAEEVRVVLVCSGEHVLPELQSGPGAAGYGNGHPRLVAKAEERLRRLGVELITSARVAALTAEEAVLNDGRRFPTRTLISSVGTRSNPLLDTLPLPRNKAGKLIVDQTCQVQGMPNVWASGDCAAVPHPNGGSCPAVATMALEQGKLIAANIRCACAGKPLKPFRFSGLGQACSMGGGYAVPELKGVELWGWPAWLALRLFLIYYVPTWDRRIRMFFDWLSLPFVGRDIAAFRVREPRTLRRPAYVPEAAAAEQASD